MDVTPEQRTYARVAGICFLVNTVLQGLGDSVTIVFRGGQTFAEKARYATEHDLLWRVSLSRTDVAQTSVQHPSLVLAKVVESVGINVAQTLLSVLPRMCYRQ